MIGLGQTGLNQLPTESLTLGFFHHRQRTDLGQVFPADMQGADPKNLPGWGIIHPVFDKNLKIPQLIIEGAQRAAKKQILVGKMLQQGIHNLNIIHPRITDHDNLVKTLVTI